LVPGHFRILLFSSLKSSYFDTFIIIMVRPRIDARKAVPYFVASYCPS
jgi:hypothetical protein